MFHLFLLTRALFIPDYAEVLSETSAMPWNKKEAWRRFSRAIVVPPCTRGVFSAWSCLFPTGADTGFGERGHLAVCSQGRFDDSHGQDRAGALTQAHLQVQEWGES